MKKYDINERVAITSFALDNGIRAASRLFRCHRNTVWLWVKEYYDYLNNALFSDNWNKNYYGRSAREACLLTKEQRIKHCNEKECPSWKHCPVRDRSPKVTVKPD
jgi:hypothetical protein